MKPTINLATRVYINRQALRSGIRAAISALLVWLLVGGYILVRDIGYLSTMKTSMETLEQKGVDLRGNQAPAATASQLKERWADVAFVNHLLERDHFRWTKLLDQLEEHALSGIVLKSIDPDVKQDKLSISGYAREMYHLRTFLDRLIASGDYQDVFLLRQSKQKLKDSEGVERVAITFEIELHQGI